jgi:GNAT superfamily N-acetyltransferase
MTAPAAAPQLKIRPVSADTWADFDTLFSARGGPSYCWCMAWRADHKNPKMATKAGRKAGMRKLVKDGVPVGLLGYLDREPVAWCSIAPFDTHQTRPRKLAEGEATQRIWSVTCFFVRRDLRGQGLTHQLLAAAVKHARKHKARLVEGYAVKPDSPSYRYMGFVPMFKAAGFDEVAREGTRRHVMQLPTRKPRAAAKATPA